MKKTKNKIAVGLGYEPKNDEAPTISVKGNNLVADQIVRAAERFGIPVVENSGLARSLDALSLDQQIPEALFEAVAIVLNQVESKVAGRKGGKSVDKLEKK